MYLQFKTEMPFIYQLKENGANGRKKEQIKLI